MNLTRIEFFNENRENSPILSINKSYIEKVDDSKQAGISEPFKSIKTGELISICKQQGVPTIVFHFDTCRISIEIKDRAFSPFAKVQCKGETQLDNPLSKLSDRELEVMANLVDGLQEKAVAKILFISEGTVKKHRKNIYQKLGLNSKAALISWWHKLKR